MPALTLPSAWLTPQPPATARTLPAACYVRDDIAALEVEHVFGASWQLVARADQLGGRGDHVVDAIGTVPLVIVRGEDDELRALHNVCRHRAGPLATCDGRGARALTCKYHGWTYALDGQLRGAPEMREAADFDPTQIRLPRALVDSWQGLVFAALTPTMPLPELLAGIEPRLAAEGHAVPFAQFRFARRVSYEIDCNWKVYVDNYLEGYHLPLVHPSLNRLLDYRSYRTECAAWSSLQWSPLDAAAGPYGAGTALYWWLWPNMMLNVLPGRLQTNRVLPLSAQRCRVDFDYWYAPQAEARAEDDLRFAEQVQQEDVAICTAVQRGLASGSYASGRLNPLREAGLAHFHNLWRAALRTPAALAGAIET